MMRVHAVGFFQNEEEDDSRSFIEFLRKLVRRGLKGSLPLVAAAKRLQDEILAPAVPATSSDEGLHVELRAVAASKRVRE